MTTTLIRAIVVLPGTVLVFVPWLLLRLAAGSPLAMSPVGPTQGRFWLGLPLAAAGFVLAAWTTRLFVTRGEGTPAPWAPPRKLVVRGPYRHVRNPMISGVLLMLGAESLLFGSWPVAGWTLVFFLVNTIYLTRVEEPGLERRFGDDYRRYSASVPRWIPRGAPWELPWGIFSTPEQAAWRKRALAISCSHVIRSRVRANRIVWKQAPRWGLVYCLGLGVNAMCRNRVVPRGVLCAAATVLWASGCESPTEVGSHALLTEGTHFQLEWIRLSQGDTYVGRIPYTFTNRTGSTVLLSNCGGSFRVGLEMRHAGEWKAVGRSIPPTCIVASPEIVIKPDEVHPDTVSAYVSPDALVPPPHASTQFRIVWHAGYFAGDGGRLPLEERVSNPFTLALPRQ